MVAEVIRQVHDESRPTYGARDAHRARLGSQGARCPLPVASCTVELVTRRLALADLPGQPKCRKMPNTPTARDLVNRDFAQSESNRLDPTDNDGTHRSGC